MKKHLLIGMLNFALPLTSGLSFANINQFIMKTGTVQRDVRLDEIKDRMFKVHAKSLTTGFDSQANVLRSKRTIIDKRWAISTPGKAITNLFKKIEKILSDSKYNLSDPKITTENKKDAENMILFLQQLVKNKNLDFLDAWEELTLQIDKIHYSDFFLISAEVTKYTTQREKFVNKFVNKLLAAGKSVSYLTEAINAANVQKINNNNEMTNKLLSIQGKVNSFIIPDDETFYSNLIAEQKSQHLYVENTDGKSKTSLEKFTDYYNENITQIVTNDTSTEQVLKLMNEEEYSDYETLKDSQLETWKSQIQIISKLEDEMAQKTWESGKKITTDEWFESIQPLKDLMKKRNNWLLNFPRKVPVLQEQSIKTY